MNSKNMFLKIKKEDIRHRISLLAISCLTFFFTYPVAALLIIANAQQNAYAEDPSKLLHNINVSIIDKMELMYGSFRYDMHLLIFLAIFAALTGFIYLMNGNASDYYHSLPCKRNLLFWVNTINGAVMVMIPCLLFELTAGVILSAKTGITYPLTYMMGHFLQNACSFLLIYAVAILSIMLTGRLFTAICGIAFLNSAASLLGSLFYLLSGAYFKTFYQTDLFAEGFNYLSPYAVAFMDKNAAGCLLCLAASVLILYLDLYLYKIRPLEAASKSFVFEKTVFPIKALVVIPAALTGAIFMQGIIGNKGWAVFGAVCGLFITHAIMEITRHSDFKKLFAHPLELVFCGVVAFTIFAVYAFDLAGYDRYLPRRDQLASTGVMSYSLEENLWELNTSYEYKVDAFGERSVEQNCDLNEMEIMDAMEIKDNDNILSLAQKAIADTKEYNESDNVYDYEDDFEEYEDGEEDSIEYTDITLAYHLKNGKTVYRTYNVKKSSVETELAKIYDDPDYKAATYRILSENETNVKKVCVETLLGRAYPGLSEEEAMQLTAAYKKELGALTMETRMHENPQICLQFRTKELLEMDEVAQSNSGYYKDFMWDGNFYPVYPSFTETIGILAKYGLKPDEILTAEDVQTIEVNYNNDEDSRQLSVTDKAQISELLGCGVSSLYYRNGMRPIEMNTDMNVILDPQKVASLYEDPIFDKSSSRTHYMEFNEDNLPSFVQEWTE